MKELLVIVSAILCLGTVAAAEKEISEECKAYYQKGKKELERLLEEDKLPQCADKEVVGKWIGVGMTKEERTEARKEMWKKWQEMSEEQKEAAKKCSDEIKDVIAKEIGRPSEECQKWFEEKKKMRRGQ